ncbi:MAG TPA: hypothetical protein VE641_20110, partial [Chthoniobacterales bacterium]|nr:hypothetical protein [Chthoniobacterales bacterium]
MEVTTIPVHIVAVNDISTVRDERVVVVRGPAMVPIASPVMPTPAKAGECTNTEPQSKPDSWTVKVKS